VKGRRKENRWEGVEGGIGGGGGGGRKEDEGGGRVRCAGKTKKRRGEVKEGGGY